MLDRLLSAVAAFYFAVMGVRLVRAVRLAIAVKRGKTVKITAEITDIKLKRLVSVKSAEAKYCLDNHEITGVMVGAFNGKISPNFDRAEAFGYCKPQLSRNICAERKAANASRRGLRGLSGAAGGSCRSNYFGGDAVMRLSTEYVVQLCFVFLLIAAACVAAAFDGAVRGIILLAIFVTASVLNIIRLARAAIFRRAVKAGNVIFRDAVIKAGFRPTGRIGSMRTAHAFAVFDDGGEPHITKITHMIGTCDETLHTGDRARIMLNSRDKSMFALSEKQVRGAVAAYAVYTAICVLFTAALVFGLVLMG